jgi:phosphopantetheinyl transferase
MRTSFYIGLSWMSSEAGRSVKGRSAEGRRILAFLDANSGRQREILYEPGGRPYFADNGGCLERILNHGVHGVSRRKKQKYYRNSVSSVVKFLSFGRPHVDFSISHSRNMVAVAFKTSFLKGRVGCDVQYVDAGKSCVEISRRFFHATEQAYIEADPAAQLRNFYRIWVLKEAWLKLHGLSVFEMKKAPAFSIGSDPQTAA